MTGTETRAETDSKTRILVLPGSFRRQSFSGSIARYAASVLPEACEVEFAALDELPLFNQDFDDDGTTPASWKTFRAQVAVSDGLLFVTPEYNRSFPAVLKNAIDIASRPPGESVWAGKPAALISTSPGRIGGALSNQHLRQPLSFLNVRILLQPEMYVSDVAALLNSEGELVDEAAKRRIEGYMSAFVAWVAAH
ncbi:MAG: NAD(P)H-dependent oxidoreductase [Coriobacteriales bacterium]|jgi:chromate reductase|nr:NAD(P)H-dependent oxidoreductase [Coriobacteriales bacterium]